MSLVLVLVDEEIRSVLLYFPVAESPISNGKFILVRAEYPSVSEIAFCRETAVIESGGSTEPCPKRVTKFGLSSTPA